jgi:hypothetical protein
MAKTSAMLVMTADVRPARTWDELLDRMIERRLQQVRSAEINVHGIGPCSTSVNQDVPGCGGCRWCVSEPIGDSDNNGESNEVQENCELAMQSEISILEGAAPADGSRHAFKQDSTTQGGERPRAEIQARTG